MNHNAFTRMLDGIRYDPATMAFVALSVVSAGAKISDANKQAKATIAEGNIVASNKAKQVAGAAATQRVSFLQSGITLEGTPMNVIESTFNTGLEDIGQIRSNYNTKARNQISAGRTAAISSLASGFAGASLPGVGGAVNNFAGDIGSGFSSLANGTGFDLGFGASQSFRSAGGGFKPGEFV